jgi:hypothetical protein
VRTRSEIIVEEPSRLAVGTVASDRQALFVANFSPQPTPGVLKPRVGVPAMALPKRA